MDVKHECVGRLAGRVLRAGLIGAVAVAMAACAGSSDEEGFENAGQVYDPLETPNRLIFAANDAVDTLVLRPLAVVYRDWVPPVFQDRVEDFLRNLRSPIILANELLQGDWEGAEHAWTRLYLNTTVGVGGLIDIAEIHGYPYRNEDFGQTLAVWGVPAGPYLVLPLIGPSNARDAVGFVADTLADPVRIAVDELDAEEFSHIRLGLTAVDARSRTLEQTDELRRSSVDYYATIRSVYSQFREAEIRDGEAREAPTIPDYGDFGEGPEEQQRQQQQQQQQRQQEQPVTQSTAQDDTISMLPDALRLNLDPMGVQ